MKIALGLLLAVPLLAAQNANDTPDAHVATAKAAAGSDYVNLFNFLCAAPAARGGGGGGQGAGAAAPRGQGGAPAAGAAAPRGGGGGGGQRGAPDRSTWYAEPVKAFDNMYFVGQSEYSVWAITTSDGIIVVDTIFDYSVEEEVDGGLKKLGLDPSKIKYAIVTHPHPDHHGGAKFLQDKYGTRIVMSAADWDFPGADQRHEAAAGYGRHRRPETDARRHDADPLCHAGAHPGHDLPPDSVERQRQVAPRSDVGRHGPQQRPGILDAYVKSAQRFGEIARQAGADMVLSNHTDWDKSKINLPLLAKRAPGSANPYIVGNENVRKYLKVAEECATAKVMRLN